MAKMVIEVVGDRSQAQIRADFYQQLGCSVQPVSPYRDVTWVNQTHGGHSDVASDPLDMEVWVVIATR